MLFPPEMADYARLSGKTMLLGDWDKVTVWNYTYYRDQVAVDDATLTERFPEVLEIG